MSEAADAAAGAAAGTAPVHRLPDGPVVLDASYLIALLDGEPIAQAFAAVLARGIVPAATAREMLSTLHAATGVEPADVEAGLVTLTVELVDLPVAAVRRFPALRAIDATRREEQRETGKRPVQTRSLVDRCVLGHALHAKLPLLTGGRRWATLRAHELEVDVHTFQGTSDSP